MLPQKFLEVIASKSTSDGAVMEVTTDVDPCINCESCSLENLFARDEQYSTILRYGSVFRVVRQSRFSTDPCVPPARRIVSSVLWLHER